MTRARELAWPALLTLLAAVVLSQLAFRGWIPHDEGQLGQSAERLLAGEVPHRDFFEAYTGGLTALHAAAFRALGTDLASLRWVLLAAVVSMVPAIYAIGARAVPPAWAALVALTALAWGPAVYFAPLPTWYTTILAVHATWCLLRHAETGRRRWLVAAGFLGGLAITVKIVGLYQVAAALLFLVLLARTGGAGPDSDAPARAPAPALLPRLAAPVAAGVLALLVVATVWRRIGPWPVVVLVLPATVGAIALAARRMERPAPLLGPIACYAAGVALPVAALALAFAAEGALGALVHGVFVAPTRRLDVAAQDLEATPLALPIVAAFAAACLGRSAPPERGRVAVIAAAVLSLWLVPLGASTGTYQLGFSIVQLVGPAAAVVGAVVLLRDGPAGSDLRALFLVTTTAGLVGLVQFPYGHAVYLAYTAPLVLLAAAHAASRAAPPLKPALGVALLGFLAFALLWIDRGNVRKAGVLYEPAPVMRTLDLPRAGGLVVPVKDAERYEALAREVGSRTAPGDAILALSDCPEVYFLTGRRNPTWTMYDAFDEDFGRPDERASRLLGVIDRASVRAAVFTPGGEFSDTPQAAAVAAIGSRLPARARVGPFVVVWRP